jgi:hypothetical protein
MDSGGDPVTITCDKCHGEYRALETNASAHVYVKDRRCNHIRAHCSHCGATEVIFLGPNRFEEVVRSGKLVVTLNAEATADLRVRAENAWAATEVPADASSTNLPPAAQPHAEGTGSGDTLTRYELTPRHEELLASFAQTLTAIPDDLLWDSLNSDHHRQYPDRWID